MSIVPSRLYRVKLFESYEEWVRVDDGWQRRDDNSDELIETQINRWVSSDKVLIVGTGPINVIQHPRSEEQRAETRTVAIIYAPPAEQDDHVYGEKPKKKRSDGQVPEQPEPGGSVSARRISDGPAGR